MTESSAPESPAAAESAVATVEALAAARDARGLSASELASKLGMAPRQIAAIERGDWAVLPGPAFVRGALRAYGKAVGLDVEPLVAAVSAQMQDAELRPAASLETPMPRGGTLGFGGGGSGNRLTWIALGIVGVVAIAFYFGGADRNGAQAPAEGQPRETAGEQAPQQPAEPANASGSAAPATDGGAAGAAPAQPAGAEPLAPLQPLSSAPAAAPGAPAGGAQPATPPLAAAPAPAPAPAPASGQASAPAPTPATAQPAAAVQAPANVPAAGGAPLRFAFERESWVEVRDANGAVLLTGMQAAQSTREVSGAPPFRLVVGNAEHVRLEFGGKPVDLASRARQGVARITVE